MLVALSLSYIISWLFKSAEPIVAVENIQVKLVFFLRQNSQQLNDRQMSLQKTCSEIVQLHTELMLSEFCQV